MVHVWEELGFTEEETSDIADKVMKTFGEAGQVDTGLRALAKMYDPEAMIAGMHAISLIQLNSRVHNEKKTAATLQKPGMN